MNIKDFNKFRQKKDKKSLNILDISLNGGIKINGEKLRKTYRWSLDDFLKSREVEIIMDDAINDIDEKLTELEHNDMSIKKEDNLEKENLDPAKAS